MGGGGRGTPYIGLYVEGVPERGTSFRKKYIGISLVEVYQMVGNAVISVFNPLSPSIHIQILQADLQTFP